MQKETLFLCYLTGTVFLEATALWSLDRKIFKCKKEDLPAKRLLFAGAASVGTFPYV